MAPSNHPKGRPQATEPVNLRLPPDMLAAIDEFRRGLPDIPTRPEAIRRLLAEALNMKGDPPK